VSLSVGAAGAANADSINSALAAAYSHNSTLNAQRAATRAVDEQAAQARSGYRPFITGDADYGFVDSRSNRTGDSTFNPYGFGISIGQTIFDGFRTTNNVAAAESNIKASREQLRRVEQQVLQTAATAYVEVLETTEIVSLRKQNIEFLEEQLRSTKARLEVGEGSRTDVAQSQARLSGAQATLAAAQAALASARGIYFKVIGRTPSNLSLPKGPRFLYPATLNAATSVGINEHPAILLTRHAVDVAAFNVKSLEGEYLPTVSLQGNANRGYNSGVNGARNSAVSATVNLTVPIYQGGIVSSQVREGKEFLARSRIQVDEARDEVRSAIVTAFATLDAARANVRAIEETVKAQKLALEGVIEERDVGQRTQLEVLDSQSDLLDAQVALVNAYKLRVTAGYALVASMGRLNSRRLGLAVSHYQPVAHFNEVKDRWIGLRTPSGR